MSIFEVVWVYLQEKKDRVHVVLPQVKGKEDYYQGVEYQIGEAATFANYVLRKIRWFYHTPEKKRYPAYTYVLTKGGEDTKKVEGAKEFVFEKFCSKKPFMTVKEKFDSLEEKYVFIQTLYQRLKVSSYKVCLAFDWYGRPNHLYYEGTVDEGYYSSDSDYEIDEEEQLTENMQQLVLSS
jgi:hypothetical protein